MADPRFASLSKDPRFIKPKRITQKVEVDPRFTSVFEASAKSSKSKDKYGRKRDTAAEDAADLRKFYKINGGDGGKGKQKKQSKAEATQEALKIARGEILMESSSDEESSEDDTDAGLNGNGKANDQAVSQNSEEDGEDISDEVSLGSDSEFSVDLDETALPGAYDSDSDLQEVSTNRLAAVNLDWDHLRAVDLFKVFASVFNTTTSAGPANIGAKPKVTRVTILPSDFGKTRMAQEDLNGPPAEIFAPLGSESSDADEELDERAVIKEATMDKGSEFNERLLRKYQLERLRYFYAVIEFDSVKSARQAFQEIQGTEFERSANMFELRCIPDDMSFDMDEARETATSDEGSYKAPDYVTDALRHSRVKLTWDQDDPQRSRLTRQDTTKLTKKQVDDMDADLATYLASGSSDEGSSADEEGRKDRMRKLFGFNDAGTSAIKAGSSKPSGAMEITFKPALTEEDVEEASGDETTLQAYKRKEKERKQRKRQDAPLANGKGKEVQKVGFDDDFFEQPVDFESAFDAPPSDSEDIGSKREPAPFNKKLTKAEKQARKQAEAKQAAEMALLVDGEAERHFDMAEIVRNEKEEAKGNSRSTRRKKAKRAAANIQDGNTAVPTDTFEMDVNDERFNVLAQDHRFAIDPSNPRYQKTKNMDKLLQETRKKRDAGNADKESIPSTKAVLTSSKDPDDIDKLVQSIKRRTESAEQSRGKSKKRRKAE